MPRTKRPALKKRLTELGVRKLKPKSDAYVVWDTLQRGLAIRIQPTGARAFKVIYSRRGRPRWYHIGDAGTVGLADARRIAARVMLEVIEGRDPQAERKAERGGGTFADLHAKYLELWAKKRNKSWRQADTLVQRYLLPKWGKLQASTIGRADVKAVMAGITAPVLANQTLASASAVFTWAMREEILPVNPCKLVDRNETRSRERILSDSEIPRFWAAFDDEPGVVSSALKTILLCGQRPGEVANMRYEHVVDNWWQMPGALVEGIWPGTKNGQNHRIWLSAPVRDIIAEMGDGATGFVFANQRGRPVSDLQKAMRNICRKLGVNETVRPHDLRRSFSTKVTALGYGREALNRVTGHREGGIASVYDRHGYADENKRIMESVAAHIMALVEGAPAGNVVQMPVKR